MGYYDRAMNWWSGTRWEPQTSSWLSGNLTKEAASTIATSLSLTSNAYTINAGQSITLTATMSPAGATGFVTFTGPGFNSGAVAVSGGAASANVTPSSSGQMTASFVGTGVYLNCSGTTNITVRTVSYKTASHLTRSSYSWGMSSAPHKLTSSFGIGTGTNDIPYSSATLYNVRIQVAGYYGRSDALTISQAGIYDNADNPIAVVGNPGVSRAGGTDTPANSFDIPDITLSAGVYRIGFVFPSSMSAQWDKHTSVGGYTLYQDGGAVASTSLLWEIDYYIYV